MIALLLAVVAVLTATCLSFRMRTLADVANGPTPPRPSASDLSIIVPARNEAKSLPILLRSIAASSLQPLEVIVVDDESTDDTADIAAAFGAHVITTEGRPPDWNGKTWALQLGAATARGSLLAFIDADVRLTPTALRRCCHANAQTGGLISVEPFHLMNRRYEQLSAFFNTVSILGSGAFALRRGIGASPVAFGPCMMTSRAHFDEVEGFSRVKRSVIEDIDVAQLYAEHGIPVASWLGGPLVAFRMYPEGLRALVQGWTKNIAVGARAVSRIPVVLAVIWVACLAAIATASMGATVAWIRGHEPPFAQVAAYVIAVLHTSWLLRRVGSFRITTAVLYPIPLAFFIAIFIRSALVVLLRRPVVWKGRLVSADARRR